jgi:hypothetical protein
MYSKKIPIYTFLQFSRCRIWIEYSCDRGIWQATSHALLAWINRCDHWICLEITRHGDIKLELLGVLTAASGVWNTWISSSLMASVAVLLGEVVNLIVPCALANAAVPPVTDHWPLGPSRIPDTSSVDPAKLFNAKKEIKFRVSQVSL